MLQQSRSFLHSLNIQTRVTHALLMREVITRYGRHNIGFLWLFLEPMLFTMGITIIWTLSNLKHEANIPITAFAVTGYSSILLWRNCSGRVIKAIEANLSLMHHRNVRVLDIFSSRIILEISGATTSMIALTILFTTLGWMSLPADILTTIEGWLLLAWFAFSLGLVIGSISEMSEIIERIWHIFTYLMFPLSGAGFMVDWFPKSAQEFLLWIPMVHGTEMIRHGFFGNTVPTHEDPVYLILFNTSLTLIGLALVKETGQRVEPE